LSDKIINIVRLYYEEKIEGIWRRIDMKNLIALIAKTLVDNPEEVVVTEIDGTQSSVIELKVAKGDIGKIIGKQGRTIVAIRTILSAASMKLKKRCILELLD
jgi:predicted RNA-binding protein YlqC (UPF0109 family)